MQTLGQGWIALGVNENFLEKGIPLYFLYRLTVGLLFYPLLPFLLLYVCITGNHREGVRQRLSLFPPVDTSKKSYRVWIHAASVGEVRAAAILVERIRRMRPDVTFVLTTMTIHGRKFASDLLPDIPCLLAPLDVPGIVGRTMNKIDPDCYVCIETELWPVLLHGLQTRGKKMLLINGRMSSSSVSTYTKYRRLFKAVLANFDRLCMISDQDRKRYLQVGVDEGRLEVTGNLKYDQKLPDNVAEVRTYWRGLLKLTEESEVLIAGSTHTGEEEMVLENYLKLAQEKQLLLILSPRHLQRLETIKADLDSLGVEFDLLSGLKKGADRHSGVILVDSFGDLFSLYSVATYIFSGGSLVSRRGHNLMEAALWGRPVLHGTSVDDFRDAADLLAREEGAVVLEQASQLYQVIRELRNNPDNYTRLCEGAARAANSQQGSARRQAEVICSFLS